MTKNFKTDIQRFLNKDLISCKPTSKGTYCSIVKLMIIDFQKSKLAIERMLKPMKLE